MLDIILIAMLAGFIALRLRSELGKKTGNEPLPPAAGRAPYAQDNAPTIDADAVEVGRTQADVIDLASDPDVRAGLSDIRRADSYFDAGQFLDGAKGAYQMILEAFWAGDKAALKDFLDDTVFSQFSAAIDQREKDGLTLENRILDVTEAKISAAHMIKRSAELTIDFSAEIIAVTRDADGKLVDGDLSDAIDLSDKWTFARDTRSKDPNWTLIATRAG